MEFDSPYPFIFCGIQIKKDKYIDFLQKTYNDYYETELFSYLIDEYFFNTEITEIEELLKEYNRIDGFLNPVQRILSDSWDLNEIELIKNGEEYICFHRYMLVVYAYITINNENRYVGINNLTNSIISKFVKFEKLIGNKNVLLIEEEAGDDLLLKESSLYNLISAIIYSTCVMSDKLLLIYYEKQRHGLFENEQVFKFWVVHKFEKYYVSVNSENYTRHYLKYEMFKMQIPGWNIFFNGKAEKIFQVKSVRKNPIFIKPKFDLNLNEHLDNKNYTHDVFVKGSEYLNSIKHAEYAIKKYEFLDVLNHLSSMKRRLDVEIIEEIIDIYKKKKNGNLIEKKIWLTSNHNKIEKETLNTFYNSIENDLKLWNYKLNHFYCSYRYDRRGRIYESSYPNNSQLVKLIRHTRSWDSENWKNEFKRINEYYKKNSDIVWKKIENKRIKEYVKTILALYEKTYWNLIENAIYYLLIKIISLRYKHDITKTNNDLIDLHESYLLSFLKENYNDSVEGSELMDSLVEVEEDEYAMVLSIKKAIKRLKNHEIAENAFYVDASSSAFQITTILKTNLNEEILKAVGFLKIEKKEKNTGVYNMGLNETLDELNECNKEESFKNNSKNFELFMNRGIFKIILMPLNYGLTEMGMREAVCKKINEDLFKKLIPSINNRELFLKFLWKQSNVFLKKYDLNPRDMIELIKIIYKDDDYDSIFEIESGFTVSLRKASIVNNKTDENYSLFRKRTVEGNLIIKNIDDLKNQKIRDSKISNLFKFAVKREIKELAKEFSSKKTINGLWVGLVHAGDSRTMGLAVSNYVNSLFESPIEVIHDSLGGSIYHLGILEHCYKKALVQYSREVLNNCPIEKKIIELKNNNKYTKFKEKEKKVIDNFINTRVKNKEKFLKIMNKIMDKEKIIF